MHEREKRKRWNLKINREKNYEFKKKCYEEEGKMIQAKEPITEKSKKLLLFIITFYFVLLHLQLLWVGTVFMTCKTSMSDVTCLLIVIECQNLFCF